MMVPAFAYLLSFLVPALGLFLVIHQVLVWAGRKPTPVVSGWLLITCLLFLSVPVEGLSLARRLAGFVPGFSVPFTAILTQATVRRLGGGSLLRPGEVRTLWRFGALTGLVLFPAALGLGRSDPYTVGWGFSPLFGVMGALSAALLLLGNRFGWILLLAIVAWSLRLLESSNYWDYLVDPVYCLVAIPMTIMGLRRSSLQERVTASTPPHATPHPPKPRGAQTDV